ncbi:MAG: hypothetical protein NVS9B15_03780 [Acidobacteriaceae bacterium]
MSVDKRDTGTFQAGQSSAYLKIPIAPASQAEKTSLNALIIRNVRATLTRNE